MEYPIYDIILIIIIIFIFIYLIKQYYASHSGSIIGINENNKFKVKFIH